mmetsp:Transcript_12076/g.28863  ORF Transcript_12076/g.28863 Transcript_12076/m.28863 type:complete len:220 (+) Transcript_12076:829-1488(+)
MGVCQLLRPILRGRAARQCQRLFPPAALQGPDREGVPRHGRLRRHLLLAIRKVPRFRAKGRGLPGSDGTEPVAKSGPLRVVVLPNAGGEDQLRSHAGATGRRPVLRSQLPGAGAFRLALDAHEQAGRGCRHRERHGPVRHANGFWTGESPSPGPAGRRRDKLVQGQLQVLRVETGGACGHPLPGLASLFHWRAGLGAPPSHGGCCALVPCPEGSGAATE